MKPGMINTNEFSVIFIAAILAVSATTVTLAAYLGDIVLSIGIIVKAYPTANASPTASTSVEIVPQPSVKPIAAPIPSPMLQPIKHLRANFVRMYDSSNTLIQERLLAYEKIFAKYGKKQNLVLRATKEIEHY